MEEILLNLKIRSDQAETIRRWIAMNIVATPADQRLAKYSEVRGRIAKIAADQGRRGADAEKCVRSSMEAIFYLVCDFEDRGIVPPPARAHAA